MIHAVHVRYIAEKNELLTFVVLQRYVGVPP